MRQLKHDLYTAIGTIGPTSRRRQDCIAPPTRQGSTPAPLVGAVGSLGGGILAGTSTPSAFIGMRAMRHHLLRELRVDGQNTVNNHVH